MRRRQLAVVALVAAGVLLVPVAPAAAETTVDPNGNVITIAIAVDIVGAEGKTSPDGSMSLVDYWEKILNETWGAAFGNLPYKNCYRFALELELTERSDDFDSTKGRHRILVSAPTGGLTFDGTGFDGTKETSRNRTTGDSTGSLENDRDGAIPVDAAPTVVAHEFGHLMGLGDDRKNGAPKNGRDGTMMVGGVPGVDVNVVQRIDQQLIKRIGEAIERYLEDQHEKPLSPCQTWKGTLDGFGDNVGICTNVSVHSGDFTIGVVADGSALVTGHMKNEAGTGCGAAGRPETTEADFTMVGEKTRRGFSFPAASNFPFPVELRVSGDHGSGSTTTNIDGVYVVTLDFEADCVENCDEEAVG